MHGYSDQVEAKVDKGTNDARVLGVLKECGEEDDLAEDGLSVKDEEDEHEERVRIFNTVDQEDKPCKNANTARNKGEVDVPR